ncbi:prokineticin-2 isoform X2 [Pipistrellus kuhlii]|uniref:Prokineticin-2 n=1 Tax=Pipistrellus kuhlii TaxID=59472 RepID=A0A7J7WE55_PIPKU|nr:prokineticin-2 isoform X2 [Pipistrellus kuhlii]KAF6335652.1 prokineticin 2 [Pipistrellus kuhlii]
MRAPRPAPVLLLLLLLWPLLAPRAGAAVITGACVDDFQCDGDTCCAVSLWIRGLRLCTPMGRAGHSCHPRSRKNHFGNGRQERRRRKRRKRKKEVPFFGQRLLHTCPCMPGLACSRAAVNRFVCSRK